MEVQVFKFTQQITQTAGTTSQLPELYQDSNCFVLSTVLFTNNLDMNY